LIWGVIVLFICRRAVVRAVVVALSGHLERPRKWAAARDELASANKESPGSLMYQKQRPKYFFKEFVRRPAASSHSKNGQGPDEINNFRG
jgi:hypothetical protein